MAWYRESNFEGTVQDWLIDSSAGKVLEYLFLQSSQCCQKYTYLHRHRKKIVQMYINYIHSRQRWSCLISWKEFELLSSWVSYLNGSTCQTLSFCDTGSMTRLEKEWNQSFSTKKWKKCGRVHPKQVRVNQFCTSFLTRSQQNTKASINPVNFVNQKITHAFKEAKIRAAVLLSFKAFQKCFVAYVRSWTSHALKTFLLKNQEQL